MNCVNGLFFLRNSKLCHLNFRAKWGKIRLENDHFLIKHRTMSTNFANRYIRDLLTKPSLSLSYTYTHIFPEILPGFQNYENKVIWAKYCFSFKKILLLNVIWVCVITSRIKTRLIFHWNQIFVICFSFSLRLEIVRVSWDNVFYTDFQESWL